MYKFTKEELYYHYHESQLNPFQIAEIYGCNHKTIRSWINKFEIPLRTASEYNFIGRKSYRDLPEELLLTPLSITAHTMYICEGWHTGAVDSLVFTNQDVMMIKIFVKAILDLYQYQTPVRYSIQYNKTCINSQNKAKEYELLLSGGNSNINHSNDKNRKNPIIKINAGGKNFAKHFIDNAYKIFELVATVGFEPTSLAALPPKRSA